MNMLHQSDHFFLYPVLADAGLVNVGYFKPHSLGQVELCSKQTNRYLQPLMLMSVTLLMIQNENKNKDVIM